MASPKPDASITGAPNGASGPATLPLRATTAAIGLCLLITLGLLPFADRPCPALPGFNAAFGSGVFVSEFSMGFVLLLAFRQSLKLSVLVLACACLYLALMALGYMLTFPGAMARWQPLLGSPGAVSWVFTAWIGGYGLLVLLSILLETFKGHRPTVQRPGLAIGLACGLTFLAAGILIAVAVQFGDRLPMLTSLDSWTALGGAVGFLGVGLLLVGAGVIWFAMRPRQELFLWLSLALTALALGLFLSAAGGGRYTLGWYAFRLSWVACSVVLLLWLMYRFAYRRSRSHDYL
jgi:Membrane-associated sensor, integral membrane domain